MIKNTLAYKDGNGIGFEAPLWPTWMGRRMDGPTDRKKLKLQKMKWCSFFFEQLELAFLEVWEIVLKQI